MKRGDVLWAWCAGVIVWIASITLLLMLARMPDPPARHTGRDVSARQVGIDNWFYQQWQASGSVPAPEEPQPATAADDGDDSGAMFGAGP
jgi:hypothetical protein